VIIPYCRTVQEQAEVIARMAEHVGRGDAVHIDVSHGFRHLPIIAILSALYLRVVRNAEIAGIWYAAFDPDSGEADVHDLAGLLRIVDWVQALHTYDKDGDYGVFAPLLGPSGGLLKQASFHERTTNPVRARAAISTWASRPDRFPSDDPAASLFSEELERRVRWYRRPSRDGWEKELALRYLEQGDYVRCAIFAVESVLSADIVKENGDPDSQILRENAEKFRWKRGKDDFTELKRIRNSLAHGGRPRLDEIKATLSEEAKLRARLESLLARLLGPSEIPG
jgi:CRISPR-associated DxTHG motif protein